jgi:hypothetical protein
LLNSAFSLRTASRTGCLWPYDADRRFNILDHRRHYLRNEALVAIADAEAAEPSFADLAQHRRIAEQAHYRDVQRRNQVGRALPKKLICSGLAPNKDAVSISLPLIAAVKTCRTLRSLIRTMPSAAARCDLQAGERAKIVVVSLKAFGRVALGALDFGVLQLRRDCADHAACHPILQIENVFECTVVSVCPDIIRRLGINELPSDANAIAGFGTLPSST